MEVITCTCKCLCDTVSWIYFGTRVMQ